MNYGAISVAIAGIMLANAVPASAAAVLPSVERVSAGHYQLDWSAYAKGKAVTVWMAEQPDAKPAKRKLISSNDRDGGEKVETGGIARPFFLIQPKYGHAVWVTSRIVKLGGGFNFRDIGGYRTANGKSVKWGQMFRSASPASFTVEDQAFIKRLGVSAIVDLRSTRERAGAANEWLKGSGLTYWTRDYDLSAGNLGALTSGKKLTADMMRETMIKGYRGFPKEQAESYRALFQQLLGQKGAVMLNCTAGKDRTGLGTALVLSALGVPYDTIKQDFLLSNAAINDDAIKNDKTFSMISISLAPDVAKPLIGVEDAYLDAAFERIKTDYGSVEAYLAKELGVTAIELKQLRKRMLN